VLFSWCNGKGTASRLSILQFHGYNNGPMTGFSFNLLHTNRVAIPAILFLNLTQCMILIKILGPVGNIG
jgi:hypothetical protein